MYKKQKVMPMKILMIIATTKIKEIMMIFNYKDKL